MKERPILFSAPMVRAILDGRKTQTRRIVSGKFALEWLQPGMFTPEYVSDPANGLCPYGAPGDRLWVKETFGWVKGNGRRTVFRADGDPVRHDGSTIDGMKWKPSIFMPRHESRLTLEVTGVRVERVQDISEADAIAEGCPIESPMPFVKGYGAASASGWFSDLWEQINGEGSWAANPWVWCVSFRKVVGQ